MLKCFQQITILDPHVGDCPEIVKEEISLYARNNEMGQNTFSTIEVNEYLMEPVDDSEDAEWIVRKEYKNFYKFLKDNGYDKIVLHWWW